MANSQFQPASTANMLAANQNKTTKAEKMVEVGVLAIKDSTGNAPAAAWSLVFPLENFQNPTYKDHVKNNEANELFGCVVHRQMLESVSKLSKVSTAERANFKLTLESV